MPEAAQNIPVPFVNDSYNDNVEAPINFYPASDQDFGVVLFATPGLENIVTPNSGHEVRALHDFGDGYMYALVGSNFYRITYTAGTQTYSATSKGSVGNSTGNAWIVNNGTDIAICDNENIYTYTPGTDTWTGLITDADFPGASCLTYQDGYGCFINPNTQQFFLTALYDFTDITATDYASAEGWPDKLISIVMHYRELWLFGPESTEIWQNTGAAFPFERISGGYLEKGCGAAGSVTKVDTSLFWLDQYGQVIQAEGYRPSVVSIPKMHREIGTYASFADAKGFSYTKDGHTFYVLTFPSGDATWVFDLATRIWHKRKSYKAGTSEYDGRWRGNCYIHWNDIDIVGDFETGELYEMDNDLYDDDGDTVVRTVYSQQIRAGGKRLFFNSLQILFEHGTSTDSTSPQAMLQFSDDGGNEWSNEIWRGTGAVGKYTSWCHWWRLGHTENTRIYKLQVSEAVKWTVLAVNQL